MTECDHLFRVTKPKRGVCIYCDQKKQDALDHGLLNIPLSKRGDINAEIDRYKREQVAHLKREAKARNARIRAALAVVRKLPVESLDRLCAKTGKTRAEVRKELKLSAWTNPVLVLRYCLEQDIEVSGE